MSNQKTIAVLGAGCAGLAAALRLTKLGFRVVLLEKADHVGGLAGGVRFDENFYEYGPHIFHTTDPEILNDIKSLMGQDLIPYERTILIKFMGNYFKFPLSMRDVLFKLPLTTVLHAGVSFLWYFIVGSAWKPKVETSETLLRRYYGDVLYQIFFKNYITNVWGIPPSEFSPDFARERIPRLDLFEVLDNIVGFFKKKLQPKLETEKYVEKVEGNLFTTHQGFSMITQRMADNIDKQAGTVHLNSQVTRIIRKSNRISAIEYVQYEKIHQIECDAIVNTLPINEALRMMEPAFPTEIVQAAQALKFRALVFVGLHISRPKVLPASFMYFREHSFNRISDLAQFSFQIQPAGSTILVAEICCNVEDRPWTDDTFCREEVLKDLVREGLIKPEEVSGIHIFRTQHAYPIYTLNYEKHLSVLLKTVDGLDNMETTGRQGRFQYINTHIAMKMAYQTADRLAKRLEAVS